MRQQTTRTTTTKVKLPKKKNRGRKRKQTGNKLVASPPAVYFPHLSPCADSYLRALTDPFDIPPQLPCVPDVISLPSHRYQTKIRGTFTVGSQGVGWVNFDPFTMATNNTGVFAPGSDQPIVYTLAAFGGTSYTWLTVGAAYSAGVTGASALSPFSNADVMAAGKQIRLVGAGIRTRYQGTELNRGGSLVVAKNFSNQDFVTGAGSTSSYFLQNFAASQEPVDRRWRGVCYTPDHSDYLSYRNYSDYLFSTSAASHRSLLLYVDGAVAGQSFQFEAVAYFELIGPNLDVTHSEADPVGFGAILSSIPEMARNLGFNSYQQAKRLAYTALEKTTSGLVTIGMGSIMRTLSNMNSAQPRLMQGPTITEL